MAGWVCRKHMFIGFSRYRVHVLCLSGREVIVEVKVQLQNGIIKDILDESLSVWEAGWKTG